MENPSAIDSPDSTSNKTVTAITAILEALSNSLADAAPVSAGARDCIKHGDRNLAIGTMTGLDSVLSDAKALHDAALVLHRMNPVTSKPRSLTRKCTREIHDALVRLLDSADDTGCSEDLLVVRKASLRALAKEAFDEELPDWLRTG